MGTSATLLHGKQALYDQPITKERHCASLQHCKPAQSRAALHALSSPEHKAMPCVAQCLQGCL